MKRATTIFGFPTTVFGLFAAAIAVALVYRKVTGNRALAHSSERALAHSSEIALAGSSARALAGAIERFVRETMERVNPNLRRPAEPLEIRRSLTIQRPRNEVYSIWRRIDELAQHMKHLDAVGIIDEKRSRWSIVLPGVDRQLEWLAEVTTEEPGSRIAWKSLPGGGVTAYVEVRFADAPRVMRFADAPRDVRFADDTRGMRFADAARDVRLADVPRESGTEVHVRLTYRPSIGRAVRPMYHVFNTLLGRLVREDVRRIKHFLEAGEIPTTEGQPVGRS